jgi:hypothetical protein
VDDVLGVNLWCEPECHQYYMDYYMIYIEEDDMG